jgi:hypothetical protein
MNTVRAQRVVVTEAPPAGLRRYDYADAFEIRVRERDAHPAEHWARCALEQAPWPARWTVLIAWRFLLQFRLGPRPSPHHVLGGRILVSEPDVIQLEGSGPLMRGIIVARRVAPARMRVTTFVVYKRPGARVVWTIAGPIHRRAAPYLMERAAATLQGERRAAAEFRA